MTSCQKGESQKRHMGHSITPSNISIVSLQKQNAHGNCLLCKRTHPNFNTLQYLCQ